MLCVCVVLCCIRLSRSRGKKKNLLFSIYLHFRFFFLYSHFPFFFSIKFNNSIVFAKKIFKFNLVFKCIDIFILFSISIKNLFLFYIFYLFQNDEIEFQQLFFMKTRKLSGSLNNLNLRFVTKIKNLKANLCKAND